MTIDGHHFRWLVDGWDVLENIGATSATITTVELTHARGVTLTKARLAPIPHRGKTTWIVGVMPGGPRSPLAKHEVALSRPAIAGTIKPGETLNLLLWLKTPTGGAIGPPTVTYTDSSGPHTWTSGTWYEFPSQAPCR
jgi:hypothetical protein